MPPRTPVAAALALLVSGAALPLSAQDAPPAAAESPGQDSAAALEHFRANINAIHQRDRAEYLSTYLRSDRLVRAGPDGLRYGYEELAATTGDSWPDTLVASHFEVTPLGDGVVYGAYRYRVVDGGTSQRGVSERVLVRTAEGWRIAATTAFPSPPGTPPPPYALVGATLIDGTGGEVRTDAVVTMRDGRVECAGSREECRLPDDAEVVDADGKWIIPGIVDSHVHFSQTGWADGRPDSEDVRPTHPYDETVRELRENPDRFFRSYVCSGVTAVFDVGGYPWTWPLRERARLAPVAPHVAAAGPLLSTRDHWVNLPAERQFVHIPDPETAEAAARYGVSNGTDAVKVWYLVGAESPDTTEWKAALRGGAAVAEATGVPLIVHATGLWQAKDALRAGARLLVHSVEDQAVDDEFLELASAGGTFYTPTLTVYEGYQDLRNRNFREGRQELGCVDPETLEKVRLTASLPGQVNPEAMATAARNADRRSRTMRTNLRRVHEAGIPVAMGTDAGNPLTLHGASVYLEMEAMAEAGLSPMEVLVASTRNGAAAMGRLEELGTVEEGKVADLVVLDADPLETVGNVRHVALVVRGGEIFTRSELESAATSR